MRIVASVDNTVVITVSDQGPGIPAEERSKATDRFYRERPLAALQVRGWAFPGTGGGAPAWRKLATGG